MRVGMLTGGGDCPGLNAVIRAVSRRVLTQGGEVIGVLEGWKGLVERLFEPLGPREISGLLPRGGTILRTSRTNPYKLEGGVERVLANFERERLDALVAIGGEDTLGVAARLYEEHGFPVVGVPKTIDNDLSATDYTFGFDTAVISGATGALRGTYALTDWWLGVTVAAAVPLTSGQAQFQTSSLTGSGWGFLFQAGMGPPHIGPGQGQVELPHQFSQTEHF